MPLLMTIEDPTGGTIEDAYVWAAETNFNFASKWGRIVFFVHRTKEASYDGKAPITSIAIDITPQGVPAVMDGDTVITPAVPSFDEMVMGNMQAYSMLAQAVYGLALSQTTRFPGAYPEPTE